MVVKVKVEFVWYSHPDTDDLFFVLEGNLTIKFRDGNARVGLGDLYIVPKGVEHCLFAEDEFHLLLIEPTGTPYTEDATGAAFTEAI